MRTYLLVSYGNRPLEPLGKARLELRHLRVDGGRGLQCVRVGCELERRADHGPSQARERESVVACAELDARDVLEAHDLAAVADAQHDALELLGVREPGLSGDGESQIDALVDGLVAEPARSRLRVLLAHGVRDVGRRQAELRELVRP